MKISDVLILRVQGHYTGPAYPVGDRQVKALDLYPEFGQAGPPGMIAARQPGSAIEQLFVEIQSD
jgi:hypothetical protein